MIFECKKLNGGGSRAGVTLTELLIVLGVLSLLAAIALPNIKTVIKQQRLSRSASDVQVFLNTARAKAISSGSPYGVIIERAGVNSAYDRARSFRLRFAYEPPAYSGDIANALGVVLPSGNLCFPPQAVPTLVAAANQAGQGAIDGIVKVGDIIEFGSVGVRAPILGIRYATSNDFSGITAGIQYPESNLVPGATAGQYWPQSAVNTQAVTGWPVLVLGAAVSADATFDTAERISRVLLPGSTLEFKIYRQPSASILAPLEMVDGTVIDLTYSGVGSGNIRFSPAAITDSATNDGSGFDAGSLAFDTSTNDFGPIIIMFDSTGAVSEVWQQWWNAPTGSYTFQRLPVSSNIFLMVARGDNVRPGDSTDGISGPNGPLGSDNAGQANIFDLESVWLVINRQTGEISADNVGQIVRASDGSIPGASPLAKLINAVSSTRRYATFRGDN